MLLSVCIQIMRRLLSSLNIAASLKRSEPIAAFDRNEERIEHGLTGASGARDGATSRAGETPLTLRIFLVSHDPGTRLIRDRAPDIVGR